MKWTLQFGAAALMLGISASAPAGLFGDAFSTHGRHGGDCCPQECVTAPSCEAPCEVDCTSTGRQHHKCGVFDRLRGLFDRDHGLCGHGMGCANEGCCPQGCVGDCHGNPVGRATVGGPVRHAAPSPATAPKKAAAAAPTQQAAPAPMKETQKAPAGKKSEGAPAPPTPKAQPKAAPAPAPPQDAEAYFPSRYRR